MSRFVNVLSSKQIEDILALESVKNTKLLLDSKNIVYFNTSLPRDIKDSIYNNLGLDLTSVDLVEMRWIKGDTSPHIDRGIDDFLNTYLIYLSDSVGELIIGEDSYPIKAGNGFIFKESTNHYTVNTGDQPRLLIGPMSETGFRVGAGDYQINLNPLETAYIKQETNILYWSTDQSNWNTIGYGPIAITNLVPANGLVYVKFITDITAPNTSFYFKCASDKIQFGDTNLKVDGTRPKIIINFDNYLGLIQNGDAINNGRSYIYVYNLSIESSNILGASAGWLGQQYFGRAATFNYIVNCSSNGPTDLSIPSSGCIIGSNSNGVFIYGCSSSGVINDSCGGIVGGNSTSITCDGCYTSGNINTNGGGIFGNYSLNCIANNCYSTGNISQYGGGIFGSHGNASSATACYNRGSIAVDAGGIFGGLAYQCIVDNCYIITTSRTSTFFGNTPTDCLSTHSYSTSGGSWNKTLAMFALIGFPVTGNVGITWTETTINNPYELTNMGYTPYNINNITGTPPALIRSYSQTVNAGNATISAIVSDKSYTILQTSGDSSYFTINSVTGVITTSSNTPSGTYTIYIRNVGSYNISTLLLTVNGSSPIPCLTEDTEVLTPVGYIEIKKLRVGDYITTSDARNVEIKDIFHEEVRGHAETYPCIVPRDSLCLGYPKKDFKISQLHLIKVGDKWIMPKEHFNLDTTLDKITYYHIRLENYKTDNLVINRGVVVESLAKSNEDIIEYYRRIDRLLYYDKDSSIAAIIDF